MESYPAKLRYQDNTVAESYFEERFRPPEGKEEHETTQAALEKVLASLPEVKGVLDLACGTGRFGRLFCEKGYRYFGADISEEMLRIFIKDQRSSRTIPQLVRCDAEYLPFRDNVFDCVVCIRFLQHVPSSFRNRIVQEMRRVSRKWLIVQARHMRISSTFGFWIRKVFGFDVRKHQIHMQILGAGWKKERKIRIGAKRKYMGIYRKA